MLPQTPVFFMNAKPPSPQEPNKTKNMNKKKQNQYSSTQYIDIINIMLNSFWLKLVKFTKNEQNKNKKPLQARHVTSKTEFLFGIFIVVSTIKIPHKNSASTPCRIKFYPF